MSPFAAHPIRTLADLLDRLGRVPLSRIRFRPPPGTATERDVLEIATRENCLCELVDGVLVEKPTGYGESILAVFVARMLGNFVAPRNLGHVTGEQGMVRLFPGLVRIPDVAFASWDRFPQRRWTGEPIPDLVPDLDDFAAGVRLVWLIDSHSRTVTVFTAAGQYVVLREPDTLDGQTVLPGFAFSLRDLFSELERHG